MLISRILPKRSSEVTIKTMSTPASLSFQGPVTKHATVKWSIGIIDLTVLNLIGSPDDSLPSFVNSQWIYSLLVEEISRPQNQGILRVMITKMLSSFLCSQSPGLSLPIFTLLHLLSRQKATNVFARIWRKIYVRLLDLMLCLSSPTGKDFPLIISRNNSG